MKNVLGNVQEPKNVTLDASKSKRGGGTTPADVTNTNLQSGSLEDELKVAAGLMFGASDAEESDSWTRIASLIPALVHVHVARKENSAVKSLSHIEETSPGGQGERGRGQRRRRGGGMIRQ